MSDSPFAAAPLDPREKPVLESILIIRDKLLLLKQDKSTYVKSQDVIPLYEQVIEQVGKLNGIREDVQKQLELNRGQWKTRWRSDMFRAGNYCVYSAN